MSLFIKVALGGSQTVQICFMFPIHKLLHVLPTRKKGLAMLGSHRIIYHIFSVFFSATSKPLVSRPELRHQNYLQTDIFQIRYIVHFALGPFSRSVKNELHRFTIKVNQYYYKKNTKRIKIEQKINQGSTLFPNILILVLFGAFPKFSLQ